jgi:hypothetical protein
MSIETRRYATNKAAKVFLAALCGLILSCQAKTPEDILTGGNYKYWLITNAIGSSKVMEYFDKTGKCLRFVKVLNGELENYPWGHEQPPQYWNMPKYNLLHWGGGNFKMLKMTNSLFIVSAGSYTDTLVPAPLSLIPVSFRKLQ